MLIAGWPAFTWAGVAVDRDDNVIQAEPGAGRVSIFREDEATPFFTITGLPFPFAVAVDHHASLLYVADLGGKHQAHRVQAFRLPYSSAMELAGAWTVDELPLPSAIMNMAADPSRPGLWLALGYPALYTIHVDQKGLPDGGLLGGTDPKEQGGRAWMESAQRWECQAGTWPHWCRWPTGVACDAFRCCVSDEDSARVACWFKGDISPRVEGPPWDEKLCAAPAIETIGKSGQPAPESLGGESVGVAIHQGQFILADSNELRAWNDYQSKAIGAPADVIISSDGPLQIARHARLHVDRLRNLLITNNAGGKLQFWRLPLKNGDKPLADNVRLRWNDTGAEIPYWTWSAVTSPTSSALFIANYSRILEVRKWGVDDLLAGWLEVEPRVLGQVDRESNLCNRGGPPNADTLCDVTSLEMNGRGDLIATEGAWECHGNARDSIWANADLISDKPNLVAEWHWTQQQDGDPTVGRQCAVTPAFADRAFSPVGVGCEPVLGSTRCLRLNDGYRITNDPFADIGPNPWEQIYEMGAPWELGARRVLRLPIGTPAQIAIGDDGCIGFLDKTWSRAWALCGEWEWRDLE
jgi:hypothetical protein